MKNIDIKKEIANAEKSIETAKSKLKIAKSKLEKIRMSCDHSDTKLWTNDDGYGPFVVERCNICGLQCDGGIKK